MSALRGARRRIKQREGSERALTTAGGAGHGGGASIITDPPAASTGTGHRAGLSPDPVSGRLVRPVGAHFSQVSRPPALSETSASRPIPSGGDTGEANPAVFVTKTKSK